MENINLVSSANHSKEKDPGIYNLLKCKCPRCRKGNMFIESNPYKLGRTMKMHETCPVCKQPFELEVGFYYGSSYVSYAMAVFISAVSLACWWALIGISTEDNRFFYWMGFNAVLLIALQPILMRVARTLWLAFFAPYDRNWKEHPPKQPERVNKDHQNNW